jgi:hypothetical protein
MPTYEYNELCRFSLRLAKETAESTRKDILLASFFLTKLFFYNKKENTFLHKSFTKVFSPVFVLATCIDVVITPKTPETPKILALS